MDSLVGSIAAAHAHELGCPLNPMRGGYFCDQAMWTAGQDRRRGQLIQAELNRIVDPDVRKTVAFACRKTLQDYHILPPGMRALVPAVYFCRFRIGVGQTGTQAIVTIWPTQVVFNRLHVPSYRTASALRPCSIICGAVRATLACRAIAASPPTKAYGLQSKLVS